MLQSARHPSKRQTTETARIAAPMGGMNTVDAGLAMTPGDMLDGYNVIPTKNGVRARTGYQEWATGLTGSITDGVYTSIPFTGSQKSGAGNRLFAATQAGIYDVSAGGVGPWTPAIAFPSGANEAGTGTSHAFATPAGRFLLYCDEEHGLYIYTESTDTWARAVSGVTQAWDNDTTYLAGNQAVNSGNIYTCAVGGISAASGGPTTTSSGISDGTVTWDYVSAVVSSVIGPSLADQQNDFTADPANFVAVTAWKSRLWFTERDTSRAWYLDVNSLYGTATSFDFGSKMPAGGPLVALWAWSYDGGSGMDTLLVGVSTAGDVVIYTGSDPNSAETFGIQGSWSMGAIPYGRQVLKEYGGDLWAVTTLGLLPLSELVLGKTAVEPGKYKTYKVAQLFTELVSAYRTVPGWSMHLHPTDNAFIVTVPSNGQGNGSNQLAMSLVTGGWFPYRELPILSACVWNGDLYFGTSDGRVCRSTGFVDNALLADPSSFDPIQFYYLTTYNNLGNERLKLVHGIRPIISAQTSNPAVECSARFDFNLGEPADPSSSAGGGEGSWDSSTWDASVWGLDSTASDSMQGGCGMGREVAIAVRGEAISRTTIVSVSVSFEQGGIL